MHDSIIISNKRLHIYHAFERGTQLNEFKILALNIIIKKKKYLSTFSASVHLFAINSGISLILFSLISTFDE